MHFLSQSDLRSAADGTKALKPEQRTTEPKHLQRCTGFVTEKNPSTVEIASRA